MIVYVDNQPQSNPSNERKQYVFNLDSILKAVGNVGDELIEEIQIKNNQANLKAYVVRNIEVQGGVNIVASDPQIEALEVKGATKDAQHWVAIDNVTNSSILMLDPASDEINVWEKYNWTKTSQFIYFKVK